MNIDKPLPPIPSATLFHMEPSPVTSPAFDVFETMDARNQQTVDRFMKHTQDNVDAIMGNNQTSWGAFWSTLGSCSCLKF